jgi:catechol 2,3-dioxygenase-like lactoylglutathione lyase family enzyme
MHIDRIDHLVMTVRDLQVTCDFYARVLGLEIITFGEGRKALGCGANKINLHEAGHEFEPKAAHPIPGAIDLCLTTLTPIPTIVAHLEAQGVPIVEGPVKRTGARGGLLSVYFRDPDGNLIEVANEI